MARIENTIDIDRPVEDVWNVVGDFGAISTWLPAIAASSFGDGVRECSMEGGGLLKEEITERDDDAHRYTYSIVESPLPIDSHEASMQVGAREGGSTVTWITEIQPDEMAAAMEPIFADGLRALKSHLESG